MEVLLDMKMGLKLRMKGDIDIMGREGGIESMRGILM